MFTYKLFNTLATEYTKFPSERSGYNKKRDISINRDHHALDCETRSQNMAIK